MTQFSSTHSFTTVLDSKDQLNSKLGVISSVEDDLTIFQEEEEEEEDVQNQSSITPEPVTKTIKKELISKRNYVNISNEMRLELIEAVHNNGEKVKNAAKRLGINYSAAKAVCQVFKREGRCDKKLPRRTGPRDKIINQIKPVSVSKYSIFGSDQSYAAVGTQEEIGNRELGSIEFAHNDVFISASTESHHRVLPQKEVLITNETPDVSKSLFFKQPEETNLSALYHSQLSHKTGNFSVPGYLLIQNPMSYPYVTNTIPMLHSNLQFQSMSAFGVSAFQYNHVPNLVSPLNFQSQINVRGMNTQHSSFYEDKYNIKQKDEFLSSLNYANRNFPAVQNSQFYPTINSQNSRISVVMTPPVYMLPQTLDVSSSLPSQQILRHRDYNDPTQNIF